MNPLRLNLRLREVRRPLSLGRALTLNGELVGTSRCDVPAREAAGGTIASPNTARTAQRAVPTSTAARFRDSRRELFQGILTLLRVRYASVRAALGLLAVVAFELPPAQAAVTEAWVHRYNGPSNSVDWADAVAVDGSGNVVMTGSSGFTAIEFFYSVDWYTAKYAAADGTLLWEQRYNGPANRDDISSALAVDSSGNVVVTGSSQNDAPDYDYDYYTAKYAAADGALLWERRYNGPANQNDFAYATAVDSSGNVVVTGSSLNGNDYDYYTAKYAAADGTLLWEQRYDVVAGSDDRAKAVTVDWSGNVVVTGSSATIKYLADGTAVWTNNVVATALAVDSIGNVVVTGDSGFFPNYDYYTAKYAAADGALLWEKRYNGPANHMDQAQAVAVDGSGNVVVTGTSLSITNGWDYYTAKYAAADGALLWEKRYNGPGDDNDQAVAVAVDGSGNVVVTGYSVGSGLDIFGGSNHDYYTAKYASADGALLWEKRYNGPGNGNERMGFPPWVHFGVASHNLALGPNGMVAITGSSDGNFGSATTYDFATVVYRDVLSAVSIDLVSTGVRLRFTGESGRSYRIERAPAVTGPWTTLATPTAHIEYLDVNPPPGQAFYRTAQP